MRYRGRFAPSPTGPLHAGSLVAALASWLDARAHGGAWLLRIEDVDTPRCPPGADQEILRQLAACGLLPDEPVLWQSTRGAAYGQSLLALRADGRAYGCACSRADIAAALAAAGEPRPRFGELVYPGTCRPERGGLRGRPARAVRLRTDEPEDPDVRVTAHTAERRGAVIHWHDRRLGAQTQALETAVGDFALQRADGLWAYQLAVVVDDAAQGISHVVRGEDLADNTPRQIHLQRALGLPTPVWLHTPLVLAADGSKLSKQSGAEALDLADPEARLREAAAALELPPLPGDGVPAVLAAAVQAWRQRWVALR
jgi:glutamyl-Q tRNA(Asp) synthetase